MLWTFHLSFNYRKWDKDILNENYFTLFFFGGEGIILQKWIPLP